MAAVEMTRVRRTAWSPRFGSIPSCMQISTVSLNFRPFAFAFTALSASRRGRTGLQKRFLLPGRHEQGSSSAAAAAPSSRSRLRRYQDKLPLPWAAAAVIQGCCTERSSCHKGAEQVNDFGVFTSTTPHSRTKKCTHDFDGFTSFGSGMGSCGSGAASCAASAVGRTSDGRCATFGFASGDGASTWVTSCDQSSKNGFG